MSLLLMTLLACTAGDPAPNVAAEPALEIRTYTVPEAHAERMSKVLRRLMELGDEKVGTVQRGPGGDLYVMAPSAVHEGVAEVVEAAGKADVPAAANLRFDYWLVDAAIADTTTYGPGLDEVMDALAEAGTGDFTLVSHHTVTARDGEEGSITSGDGVEVKQMASVDPNGGIFARLDIDLRIGDAWHEVDTSVQLEPGQTMVLAAGGSQDSTLYYVIRPHAL